MGPGFRRDDEGISDHTSVDAGFFTRSVAGVTKKKSLTESSVWLAPLAAGGTIDNIVIMWYGTWMI
jgi:hypothetical protein